MIPGDGVGPDLMYSVQDVIKAAGAPLDFEVLNLSEVSYQYTVFQIVVLLFLFQYAPVQIKSVKVL